MAAVIEGSMEGFTLEEYLDVKKCLETLLSVAAGEQPLDRDFGIDYNGIVGYPPPVAKNMLSLEIQEKVERYEPRVNIDYIEFDVNESQIIPHIYFIKAEEDDE